MELLLLIFIFFFNVTATTEIYTLSLHDALPISKVRITCTTWAALRIWTGTAHGKHDQITHFHTTDSWTHFHHFTKRFVANYQVFRAFWRRPIFKSADFFVCATNADLKHAHFDVIGLGQMWCILLDDPD